MFVHWDPDEWETIYDSRPCSCGGSPLTGHCRGNCNASVTVGYRPRPPEERAKIRAEKRIAREDAILAEADAIRARRAAEST